MSRLIVVLIVLLVLVAGALFFLSGRAGERPTTRIETPVEINNLAS